MKKFRVLWSLRDAEYCPESVNVVRELAQVDYLPPSREALLERIADYDAYFTGAEICFDREAIQRAKRLKVVAAPSTGTDHLDVRTLAERGVTLLALTEEYEVINKFTATAETAWGLLIACIRRIPTAVRTVLEGKWSQQGFMSWQLSCKTLGVLGVGRLGKMVVEYGKAFRMRVLGCDLKKFNIPGVEQVDFDTLLRESDVLSIHVHLTDETRGLISRKAFVKMKDGVVIINTSRGAIIDEQAFLEALKSSKVSAAGLDVIDGEWMEDISKHPLVQYAQEHDTVLIIPHIASATVESTRDARMFMGHRLADFLRNLRGSS